VTVRVRATRRGWSSAASHGSDGPRGNALRQASRDDNQPTFWGSYSIPVSLARHTVVGHHNTAPLLVSFALSVRTKLERSKMAMEYTRCRCSKDRRWQWSTPGAVVAIALWVGSTLLLRIYEEQFSSSERIYRGLEPVATLLLWLYFTGAAILIGGEANSEIEKAASEAGHPDVRRPEERRSGGTNAS
jgi:hypothetical protein